MNNIYINDDIVLLLTATVNPNNMPGSILDIQKRVCDYKNSLKYYVENHVEIRRIVFAENSGYDLFEFDEYVCGLVHDKEVEFLSFESNHFPREFGKGYGELSLISDAISHSNLIKRSKYIAKVTGRIVVSNISEIIGRFKAGTHLQCDIRDHGIYEFLRLPYCGRQCDTRFIIFSKDFFNENFKNLNLNHTKGNFSLEQQFYTMIKKLEHKDGVLCRFPVEAIYQGIAGHKNKNYSGFTEKFKRTIRNFCRKFFPNFKI